MKSGFRALSLFPMTAIVVASGTAFAQTNDALTNQARQVIGAAQPIHVQAVITGIDPSTRTLIVHGPRGDSTVLVNKEVTGFDQLHIGDQVDVQYKNALLSNVEKVTGKDQGLRKRVDTQTYSPASGANGASGFDSSRQVEILATVVRVDKKHHTVTLRGPWRTETMDLPPDLAADNLKKGDTVHAVFVSAAAVKVTPVAASK
ncbi:hypothetical protein P9250_14160 [Caballeronia sp. LP006]|uniref:hypothetical protein n=1 Tax=Caballeronia sp. LP006 TaxID=3038552 RepID=UPI0028577576|nr:hypothetical protein [Caballeronia sp. LP006]MDR5829027.1 hypothetical protein [Caballeronia sp. LP006]